MLYTVGKMAKAAGACDIHKSGNPKEEYEKYKIKIIFTLRLGLATVWAQGNYSLKLF